MTRRPTPLLGAYAAVAALGLLGALALRRPELAAIAAPFALLLALGLRSPAPAADVWVGVGAERVLEQDELPVTVTVRSAMPLSRLELALVLPAGIELVEGRTPVAIGLGAGEERELPLRLRCTRWGTRQVGDVWLRSRDPIGVVTWEGRADRRAPVRVYPRPEHLRELLPPAHTQATTGDEPARARAEGLEFVDMRPYAPGDRARAVNWRASARRGTLVVNDRHPERNADVVLFLDSFAEARESAEGTFEQAVRVTATLAARFLERRDRVGLVSFGGILRWLEPRGGMAQRYRLVDALLESGVELSWAWKDVDVIPARTLPARALVVAVTPLLDERSVAALVDLRARGHDLAIVEIPAEPFAAVGDGPLDETAHRLWRLQRVELRRRFQRLGVGVTTVAPGTPLDVALEEVRSFRRHARLARR